jgi:microcin C transport system permease protein
MTEPTQVSATVATAPAAARRLWFGWAPTPLTQKRWRRFRQLRRAYWSLWLLAALSILGLAAELVCNDRPLLVKWQGAYYVPFLRHYPETTFTGSGRNTRPDYKALQASPQFADAADAWMLFPVVPFGPYESVDAASLPVSDDVTIHIAPESRLATVNVDADYVIGRSRGAGAFFGVPDASVRGLRLTDVWRLPADIDAAVRRRLANHPAPRIAAVARGVVDRGAAVEVSLSTYNARAEPPTSVRVTLREAAWSGPRSATLILQGTMLAAGADAAAWQGLTPLAREQVLAQAAACREGAVTPLALEIAGEPYIVRFETEAVHYPFRPVAGHWLGLDNTGRDVLARLLYALRTTLLFAFLLVLISMALGIALGAVQGYCGGAVDIIGQRGMEIWAALPFLYVIILMGNIYGRSFALLLICYATFNWLGIAPYVRAEFLRLRGQPFIDAARCMGIPHRLIVVRHILPNALVPVVTFLPFSFAGAIAVLTSLDFLSFGLPPPTPSWGELLDQARSESGAWWLILYPSLAIFSVTLLFVFIGEGIRQAFQPRQHGCIR